MTDRRGPDRAVTFAIDPDPDPRLVRVEATVPLDRAAAWALLTVGTGGWWPRVATLLPGLDDAAVAVVMEIDPEVGGRWGERTTSGGEHPWGTVRELDPPRGLTLDWTADPEAAAAGGEPVAPGTSTVVVRLAEVDDDLTTVIVEHRDIAAHGVRAAAVRGWAAGDDGWWAVLRAYAATARA